MSKIAEKIAKILAKATSTNSEAEADSLMAKVNEMLEAHGLTYADLAQANAEDPVGQTKAAAEFWASQHHRLALFSGLAKLYGARLVYTKLGNKYTVDLVGRESARVTFQLMVPFVLKQINDAAKTLIETGAYTSKDSATRAVSNRLAVKAATMARENEQRDVQRVREGGFALVPVDLVDAAMGQFYPRMRESRASRINVGSAAAAAAAAKISLFQQTKGSTVRQLSKS
jgi:hypothetical protein